MNDLEERKALFNEISNTNIIGSLKSQFKRALADRLLNNKAPELPRPISEESEIANNIILEFLFAAGFHNTASVFFSESKMHQMPRESILESVDVGNGPGTIAELLVHPQSLPSISTQTEFEDLGSKLNAIDEQVRKKRQMDRALSCEETLHRGIDEIDKDIENRFNTELKRRLDIFRASELATYSSTETARNNAQLEMIKKELEADLRQKTNEMRRSFDKSASGLRTKQRELETEIGKWAERNVENVKLDAKTAEVRKILAETEEKAKQIKAKTMTLAKKMEKDLCRLEDEQLEHRKTKREVEKLRMSIAMLEQNMIDI